MPLEDALKEIERQSGVTVNYDPYAVPGVTAKPVRSAPTAQAAIREAIADSGLTVFEGDDGSLNVGNTIVVLAQRDEAETSILVRDTSTSSRNGTSLREQPRNAQVISSKLIAEQQATDVRDALRYGGGVSGGIDGPQGRSTFYIRGLPVTPLSNGMVGSANGIGGNIENVERIEVLKGPDAVLAGSGNLSGLVNVVTKKPFAEFFAEAIAETGINFADYKLTGDVNGPLTGNRLVSARIIASVAGGGESIGGYNAADGYAVAPSIRFKDGSTDILASASISDGFVPLTPAAIIPTGATTPLDHPRDKPFLGRGQGINVKAQQYLVDASHEFTPNISATLRYQHQDTKTQSTAYSIFGVAADGAATVFTGNSRQTDISDAIDGFVRLQFDVGPVSNTLNAGFNYINSDTTTFSGEGGFVDYNILIGDPSTLPPLPTVYDPSFTLGTEQRGYYVQNLFEVGPVHIVAGIRRTDFTATADYFANGGAVPPEEDGATTISSGIVVDVAPAISVFANYLEGFEPNSGTAFGGGRLPNIKSKNREAGIKIDLFRNSAVLNLSYFQNDQSNILFDDLVNGPPFLIAGPGLRAEGVDFNFSGEILPGWTFVASFTRTNYDLLAEQSAGEFPTGVPRDTYSAYSNYGFDLGRGATASLGGGITGRSSAIASPFGDVVSPAARQIDLNAAIQVQGLSVRLGVRNLLDRDNFDVSFTGTELPIAEPRNLRLTVGYRF